MNGQQIISAGSVRFGLVNVPDVLFKFFSDERHARGLAEAGSVRIGTLYEFRHTDGWDHVRGDGEEGQYTFSLVSDERELITRDNAPWFLRQIIDRVGPIASHGGALNAVAHHPNSYIYCTTSTADPARIANYGSVGVAIRDVPRFFAALTEHLTDHLRVATGEPHGYAAPCLYLDRELRLGSAQTPVAEPPLAFLKPSAKIEEGEVRGIWHPTPANAQLSAVVTQCAQLAECCEML